MKHSILAAAAVFAVAAMVSTPASARPLERFATPVSYADLNLDNRAGADVMISRIESAAREGCGARFGRIGLREHLSLRACMRGSADRAVTHLGHPLVTALYIERDGRPGTVTVAGAN